MPNNNPQKHTKMNFKYVISYTSASCAEVEIGFDTIEAAREFRSQIPEGSKNIRIFIKATSDNE